MVKVRAGNSIRKHRVVKSDKPGDLVFQSVRDGKPLRDNNILSRFIKPAGRELDMPWLNWRTLRTSHAVWLKLAGADPKDAQTDETFAHFYDDGYLHTVRSRIAGARCREVEHATSAVNWTQLDAKRWQVACVTH